MGNVITVNFQFSVIGASRDECIDKMDYLGMLVIDSIGGAPWVVVDDDFKKIRPQNVIGIQDDQGFAYQGMRTYVFSGPVATLPGVLMHEGFKAQGLD